jgi:hypothetical protein
MRFNYKNMKSTPRAYRFIDVTLDEENVVEEVVAEYQMYE